MSKLYIFGIGGTGSRVLRALTMLLAAGVKCDSDRIIPIIIDPDEASADMTRTVEIMKNYCHIRKNLDFTTESKNRFFSTKIQQTIPNFRLPLRDTRDISFERYMSVNTMSKSNQALINMLFSQDNLESDMQVGFKGNPNIGSVVLNQFSSSPEFIEFANNFQQGDKIFIISSIFGGTGASGFPLLLKTLRSNTVIPNFNLIQNAQIGAVSVLPYFKVKTDNESKIDSATFISKTKSALSYYERNISKNKSIDKLYYVADDICSQYENHEGGQDQRNNAHIVELISALAILDFADSPDNSGQHMEFGVESDSREIIFENLGSVTQNLLKKTLTQFILFTKYLKEKPNSYILAQSWAKDYKIDSNFLNGNFVKDITKFQNEFFNWLEEMDSHDRKFSPFELEEISNRIFEIVKGVKPRSIKWPTWKAFASNFDLFSAYLNNQKVTGNKEQIFMELFYNATIELTEDKFNLGQS